MFTRQTLASHATHLCGPVAMPQAAQVQPAAFSLRGSRWAQLLSFTTPPPSQWVMDGQTCCNHPLSILHLQSSSYIPGGQKNNGQTRGVIPLTCGDWRLLYVQCGGSTFGGLCHINEATALCPSRLANNKHIHQAEGLLLNARFAFPCAAVKPLLIQTAVMRR